MADKTGIAWTDATWNIFTGCNKISEGCKNCYAERDWSRLSHNPTTVYFNRRFSDVMFHPERLSIPEKWTRPRRIFVNSMSDLFHENISDTDRDKVFDVMENLPRHVFQILTKRPAKMKEYMTGREQRGFTPRKNIWLGVTVENQDAAAERIPLLISTPASLRWLSIEPLLSPVVLSDVPVGMLGPLRWKTCPPDLPKIDWVVVGGESGSKARDMKPEWALAIIDECKEAGTPVFFKQGSATWGREFKNMDVLDENFSMKLRSRLRVREFPKIVDSKN